MSTAYSEFEDKDGKTVYVDASGSLQRINICGTDDTDIYFRMDKEDADALIMGLWLSYEHNGWELPYPWDEKEKTEIEAGRARRRRQMELATQGIGLDDP